MTDLFTLPDLASRLQLATIDTATATLARDEATGILQSLMAQNLFSVTGSTVILTPPRHSSQLVLPERPVNAVTSVLVDGSPISSWYFDGQETVYSYNPWGWGAFYTNLYPRVIPPTVQVTVTYDHGYTVIPQWLRTIALKIAAKIYDNPQGLKSVGLDDFQAAYGGNAGGLLDDTDMQVIKAQRRTAFSVSSRR